MIQFPLDLPDVKVLKTEMTKAGDLIITVESTREGATCRRCGREIGNFHGYDKSLRLRHLPILDQRVYIEIRPQRYRCPYCDDHPTSTQRCEWYEPNSPHTKAFEQWIMRALINSTVVDVSRKYRLGEEAVEGILNRHVAGEVDWTRFTHLGVLGVDEIALTKGHQDFVTIVTCRGTEGEIALLAILPDRRKETVKAFLASIPAPLKTTIEQVCTDMYEGFVNAAEEELLEADRVVDRFQVAKAYRGCADELRKQEFKRLKKTLSQDEYEATVKGTMWLFRTPWVDLKDEERVRLEKLFEYSPALKAVHLMREILTVIFDTAPSKAQATAWLQTWRDAVILYEIPGFDRFLITLDNWMDEITNYFLNRQTSGFVEGLNNKIKVLKRRCYGMLNLSHLFQRLHLDLEGYQLFGWA
jgi:transposase